MDIYTVRKGDSLSSIARSFGLDEGQLRRLNQLSDPRRLSPGMSLLLDRGSQEPPRPAELCAFLSPGAESELLEELLPDLSWLCVRGAVLGGGAQMELPRAGELISLATRHSVLPLLSLSNLAQGGYSPLLAHQLLADQEAVRALLTRLPCQLEAEGYRGVELNFQYMYSFDMDNYSRFVAELSRALHAAGCYLFVSLAPKTEDTAQSPLCAAQDYPALGDCADRLILLCHDWGAVHTPPQAISPADRVESALDYALSALPRGKTILSLSACGCAWSLPWRHGDEGRHISSALAAEMAVSTGAEVKFDPKAAAAFFTCGSGGLRRVVWYEDCRSLQKRMSLASQAGLAGLSLRSRDRLYRPGLCLLLSRFAGEKLI